MPLFKPSIDKGADDQAGELARVAGVSPFDSIDHFRSRTDPYSELRGLDSGPPCNVESVPQFLVSFPHLRRARGHVDADLEDVALLCVERVKYGVPSPAK